MKYELYVDIYFLVNFMLNYLVLTLTEGILHTGVKRWRILLSSIAVAGFTLFVLVIDIENLLLQLLLGQLTQITLLIFIGLKIGTVVTFIKGLIISYLIAIITAGIMQIFSQYMEIGSLFFFLVVLIYYAINSIFSFMKLLFMQDANILLVALHIDGEVIHIKGLYDTGNSLSDPISHKPVSVLCGPVVEKIAKHPKYAEKEKIPFHTIGGSSEIELVTISAMNIVRNKEQIWIKEPLIALSKENIVSSDRYEIILNPEII